MSIDLATIRSGFGKRTHSTAAHKGARHMKMLTTFVFLFLLLSSLFSQEKQTTLRPMTFMDVIEMRSVSTPVVSPDGKWCLYTLSTPDWKAGKSFTDIYLVSLDKGLGSTRQMTFTKDKNELAPQWSKDNTYFVFSSNRDAPEGKSTNQIYVMRVDGGEAQKITDAKEGIGNCAFSRDGKWFAFTAGKEDDRQL